MPVLPTSIVAARGMPFMICAGMLALAASPADARSWQRFVADECLGSSTNCFTQFYKVGKKKRLEITGINCMTQVAGNGVAFFVRIKNEVKAGGYIYDYYLPVKTGNDINGDYNVVNAQTQFIANAGDKLTVQAIAETDIRLLQCKISGELTKAN